MDELGALGHSSPCCAPPGSAVRVRSPGRSVRLPQTPQASPPGGRVEASVVLAFAESAPVAMSVRARAEPGLVRPPTPPLWYTVHFNWERNILLAVFRKVGI